MNDKLVKMAIDLANGSVGTNFSAEQVNETLRQKFIELNGGSEKLDRKAFRRNQTEIFEILEEALDVIVGKRLEDQFKMFAEVRNVGFGDKPVFTIKQKKLFPIAKIASGNSDLSRYRLDKGELTVDTDWYGVAVYEELERFLAGRVDWVELIDIISESMAHMVASDIYKAIYDSYNTLGANYQASGVFDEVKIVKMAQRIKTATGAQPVVYGTLAALQKAVPSVISDQMRDARNSKGFYATVAGIQFREIEQAFEGDTENFAIADDFLLVVPEGKDTLIKVLIEGESLIEEVQSTDRKDDQKEYKFRKKMGIAVLTTTKYGIYKLS